MNLIAFIIFAAALILIIIFALYLHFHKSKEKDYMDFFCVFSGSFALYSIVGTLDRVGERTYELKTSLIVYMCIVIGYICFVAGYNIVFQKYRHVSFETRGTIKVNLIHSIHLEQSYKITDLLFLIFVLFFCMVNCESIISMIQNFGSGTSYVGTAARSARTALSGPMSLFASFFMLFFLGFPFVRVYKNREIRLLDIVIIVLQTSFSLTSGHRTSLLIIGIIFLGIYNYRVRHIKLTWLLAIAIVAMSAFVAIGHLRAANSISGMFNMLKGSNIGIIKATNTGEFYNTVGTFFTYVEAIGNGNYSLNYGYTWIVDLLVYIPYFLFPGRPLPWAEQHMLDFHSEVPAGLGFGWYVLNDGYMSFGVAGIIIEMFMLGIFLANVYYFLRKRMDSPYIAYMYCMVLSSVFLLSRGSFLGIIKTCFLEISPLILIYNFDNLAKGKIRWKRSFSHLNQISIER